MTARVAASLILALLAAFCFGLSNVLEQREAEQLPDDDALRPTLVTKLARRPWWVLGFGVDVGGWAFHAAALAFGSLVFVQPLLVTGLLFALGLRALITGQPLSRHDFLAGVVLAAGLALFLLGVSPHGGDVSAPISAWVIAGPVVIGAIALCVALGARRHGPPRALLLGIAAGISFGVAAVFTKTFVHLLGAGIVPMLEHWEPYALAVASITGLILAQSSFQAGSLAASIAALEVSEPVVAAVIGIGLLNEDIATRGFWVQLGLAAALLAMFFGVVGLSRSVGRPAAEQPARIRTIIRGHGGTA